MTHKKQSAPTETFFIQKVSDADTTQIQEDSQRAGLIWYEGAKKQKKTTPQRYNLKKKEKKKKEKKEIQQQENNDVSFRSQHADVASSESKAIWS